MLSIRIILKKIPIIRRVYNSISVRILKLFNKKHFVMNFMDTNFHLNIDEPIEKSIILFNYYENDQLNLVFDLISAYKVNTIFDIGAHSGIYSLVIANKFHNIEIHSFEPVKFSFDKLNKNILINKNVQNINTYNFGLSNSNSILNMKAYNKNNFIQLGGFGVIKKGDKLENNYVTKATFKKGDDYFRFKNKTIFLKIDVEGHEMSVLDGISKLIKNNKIIIQVEIFPENYGPVKKKLKKMNFEELKKINSDYFFIKMDTWRREWDSNP